MLETLRRRREDEEGFTLIELMVVVLIIAILLAIAIPTFLGAQKRAKDRAAQSNLRNGYTAAKTVFSDKQTWPSVSTGDVQAAEPNLTVQTAASTAKNQISMAVGSGSNDYAVFGVRSDNAKCFYVMEVTAGTGNSKGPGTWYASAADGGSGCNAASPGSVTWSNDSGTGW